MKNKFVIWLMLMFFVVASHAQDKTTPPHKISEWPSKKFDVYLPELRIDSVFMARLEDVLHNENDSGIMNFVDPHRTPRDDYFHMLFCPRDSSSCYMEVSGWPYPTAIASGYVVKDAYRHPYQNSDHLVKDGRRYYFFTSSIPDNIVLSTGAKMRFSWIEVLAFVDPWYCTFTYNFETGELELISHDPLWYTKQKIEKENRDSN